MPATNPFSPVLRLGRGIFGEMVRNDIQDGGEGISLIDTRIEQGI